MKQFSLLFAAMMLLGACRSETKKEVPPPVMPKTIEEAVASNYRTPENRSRDQYRHPSETLNFFGLKPEMTVIEVLPGAGWYLEILAPLLNEKGQYISALMPSEKMEMAAKMNGKINAWIKARPELDGKVKSVTFDPPTAMGPDNSADMILTFRNVHNWAAGGIDQAAFNAFFKALKKGGVLGVVEHRADAKSKRDPKAKSGYMREVDVIALAKKAGFKLDAKSEINANPKDTKKHPEGVWTLPPTLRLGDTDKDKYVAIGESDRMTLRFVKP